MNSYSAGVRTGLYLHEKLYPYIGIALKGTYIRESDDRDTANFTGYGADLIIGFYIMFKENIGIFGQYNYSWVKANDENSTSLGGQFFALGGLYKI